MLTEEIDDLMYQTERASKFFDFFEAVANVYVDIFGARALMELAIDSGFEKSDVINFFIDDEELYESIIKEKESND